MRAFRTTTLLTASALSLLIAAPALAAGQESAPTSNNDPALLGELVVTAQKRAQDPVEVPIAVTAYSGKFLEAIGVKAFDELSAFTPGFLVQNQSNNNSGFVMRGITSDSGSATDETRVSIYQDGVPISRSRGSYVELFDMERVEIAKGPQSTLFGRGALIGAVNLVQNKANPGGFDWAVKAEAGTRGYRVGEAMVNFAFGESSALRIAARTRQADGYVKDAAGGDAYDSTDTQAIRVGFHTEAGGLKLIDQAGRGRQPGLFPLGRGLAAPVGLDRLQQAAMDGGEVARAGAAQGVFLKRGDGCLLQGCGGSHGEEVVDFSRLQDHRLGGLHIAEAPTGHRVGFGQGIAGDRSVERPGERGERDVFVRGENNVLIGFVGDEKRIMAFGEFQDEKQFLARENLAGGIRGIAENQSLGS